MATTPVFLPGKSHGQRSLAGYSQSMGSQRVGPDLATKQLQEIGQDVLTLPLPPGGFTVVKDIVKVTLRQGSLSG